MHANTVIHARTQTNANSDIPYWWRWRYTVVKQM